MAKVSLFLDTRYKKGDKYALKISVAHNGTTAYYQSGISLPLESWQAPTKDCDGFVKKSHTDYKSLNNRIQHLVESFESAIVELERRGQLYSLSSAKDLRNYIASSLEGRGCTTFLKYFAEVTASKTTPGTKRLFEETYRKLIDFTKGKDLLFEQINVKWLEDFASYMGGGANYKSIHLRNIRTVYNHALKRDVAKYEYYPFRKYTIKKEKTAKRDVTPEQLAEIANMELLPHQERYRDIFLLSIYLLGINMTDLLHLTADNLVGDRLYYKRHKTKRIYDIKVEKEAMEIINRYRGKNYLLNFLDTSLYDSILSRINKNLKELGITQIGKHGKLTKDTRFKFLSSYYCRHTWATLASYLEIPKETIAAALGHGGNDVTDIYINFDRKKIDEANRKVIDFIQEKRKVI